MAIDAGGRAGSLFETPGWWYPKAMEIPPLVPELQVQDLDRSLAFYVETLGFSVAWSRPEEQFAFLRREQAAIMLEQAEGPGRRITTGPLEHPFGRGINFQIIASNVDELAEAIVDTGHELFLPLEERLVRVGTGHIRLRQFIVSDLDGYLLRFVHPHAPQTSAEMD